MKRFIYFLIAGVMIFSLSGCGGGNSSNNGSVTSSVYDIKEVAVISSPAIEMYKNYKIYSGAELSGMDNAKYYVANIGNETTQATLNLGFSDKLDTNSSLVVINDSTGAVVFAYDPSGVDNQWKTGGNIKASGGKLLHYRTLSIDSGNVGASVSLEDLGVESSDVMYITLSSTTAKYNNNDYVANYPKKDEDGNENDDYDYRRTKTFKIVSCDRVWHADPSHEEEYYTNGLDGEEELDEYDFDIEYEENDSDFYDRCYIAHDIRYMNSDLEFSESQTAKKDEDTEYVVYYELEEDEENDEKYIFATLPQIQGLSLSDIKTLMTHTSKDAYNCPVLHIASDGVYSLSGTWNGQIHVDEGVYAVLILNGLTVNCKVGPAILFESNYELGETDSETIAGISLDIGQTILDDAIDSNANLIILADGKTNKIIGSNVYRILKHEQNYDYEYDDDEQELTGTNISEQEKLLKYDGAIYSQNSIAIATGDEHTGKLTVTSTSLEGIESGMHLVIENGSIDVIASDDAINVNEDYISTFTMLGGTLNIKSTYGDGIDSNGYVVINGGTLNVTAGSQSINSAGEAGIDSECGTYISDDTEYNWTKVNDSKDNEPEKPQDNPDDENKPDEQQPDPEDKPDNNPDDENNTPSPENPDEPSENENSDTDPESEDPVPSDTPSESNNTDTNTNSNNVGSVGEIYNTNFDFDNTSAVDKVADLLADAAGNNPELDDLLDANIIEYPKARNKVDDGEIPDDEKAVLVFPIYRVSQPKIYLFAISLNDITKHLSVGSSIYIHATEKTVFGGSFYSSATETNNAVLVDDNGNEITTLPKSTTSGFINAAVYMNADTNYSFVLTTSTEESSESSNSSTTNNNNNNTNNNNNNQWQGNNTENTIQRDTSTNIPSDANIAHGEITTDRGTTSINIGTGNNASFIAIDNDSQKNRIASPSGTVLQLDRKVNTFSGIVAY